MWVCGRGGCARLVVRRAGAALVLAAGVSLLCSVLPLALRAPPSFADPALGFETRGTHLACRARAWDNLLDEARPSRRLAADPREVADQLRMNRSLVERARPAWPARPRDRNTRPARPRDRNTRPRDRNSRPARPRDRNTRPRDLNTRPRDRNTRPRDRNTRPRDRNTRPRDRNTRPRDRNTQPARPRARDNYQTELHRWTQDNRSSNHQHWSYGRKATFEGEEEKYKKIIIQNEWETLKLQVSKPNLPEASGSYFCGSPMADYAHLVVTTVDRSSLLTYDNLQSMCQLQTILMSLGEESYNEYCQKPSYSVGGDCCPQWTVPNYIALMSNKTSCLNITQQDINKVVDMLERCAPYFHNLNLTPSCSDCVPNYCTRYDAIYNILFYLVDTDAFPPENKSHIHVSNAMIFLPLACSSTTLSYYLKLHTFNMTHNSLVISAIDFGLKNSLFDMLIIEDTWLVGLGGFFVFLCVWVYSGSLLLTVMLFIAIAFSLGVSYFIYTYVFNLDFFPFMNLLVIVIVIGIGADDAFLYIKVWKLVKSQLLTNEENNLTSVNGLLSSGETMAIEVVNETLKHSVLTMFVTTLTTAVAFFASYVSYIPAINCFSVFAGTAVLVNFIFMITWLPATVYILDTKINVRKSMKWEIAMKPIKQAFDETHLFFNRIIIFSIQKLHFPIIIILGGVGICSTIVVFYYPGLQLPDTKQFQLFQSSHPFEQYDLKYKDKFMFERFNKNWGVGSKMPLYWIWGVKALDNGNHMNPSSKGHLEFENSFNISDPESQQWLLGFCARLKAQSFYQPILGALLANCFIESLINWMGRSCIDPIDKIDWSPCCETSVFPYSKEVFDLCIVKAAESLYQTDRKIFLPGVAGPKFLRGAHPPSVAALVVEFESVVSYSMSYSSMNNFYLQVENWTQHELKFAPAGMKAGWFLSDLQFYDLQGTLASGTVIALILSAALGFLVLLPATLNFVVSICALLAMAFSVTVTIAMLVLIGWKLNILESVAISTSAGLAVDFSLHYALSYTYSCGTRSSRVLSALNSSVGPTAAAALTTGFAGIFLLYSSILPYSQIGTFLALIMSVSWSYSTWFLCSMLLVFGSNNSKAPHTDDRRSMSRVSSVCSGVPNLESHELEHFADSNRTIVTHPHSPSNASATTVVLHEELEALDTQRKE